MTENYCSITDNLAKVEERIANAAIKSGRNPQDITLLAVTKTVDAQTINKAIAAGVEQIGENYVSEIVQKADDVRCNTIHLIGHLQSNKIKTVLPHITMLQTLDSIKLANKLQTELEKQQRILDVLLQVNIGEESSKSGLSIQDIDEMLCALQKLENLRLRGLMAIPPVCKNGAESKYFNAMLKLYIDIKAKKLHNINNIDILSMGMSNDFETAIEYGSTLVRIGSSIFGDRK